MIVHHHGQCAVYLRLSVTDRCNLRCRYCRPVSTARDAERASQADDSELLSIVRIIQGEHSIDKLRLTGGEPLLYPRLTDLIVALRQCLPRTRLCLTTNGTRLARKAELLKAAGLDSLNVSLDTLDEGAFRELTGGGSLQSTIAGIIAARKAGFTGIKLNAVLIRGVNARGLADLVRFAAEQECEIRFIELMPYGQGAALFRTDYFSADEALDQLKREFSYVERLAHSSTADRRRYLVDGREVNVGFITPVSHPFCSRCNRLRLSRGGRLFACLRQQQGMDLLAPLRSDDPAEVRRRINSAIGGKHNPGAYWPDQNMVSIGG